MYPKISIDRERRVEWLMMIFCMQRLQVTLPDIEQIFKTDESLATLFYLKYLGKVTNKHSLLIPR